MEGVFLIKYCSLAISYISSDRDAGDSTLVLIFWAAGLDYEQPGKQGKHKLVDKLCSGIIHHRRILSPSDRFHGSGSMVRRNLNLGFCE